MRSELQLPRTLPQPGLTSPLPTLTHSLAYPTQAAMPSPRQAGRCSGCSKSSTTLCRASRHPQFARASRHPSGAQVRGGHTGRAWARWRRTLAAPACSAHLTTNRCVFPVPAAVRERSVQAPTAAAARPQPRLQQPAVHTAAPPQPPAPPLAAGTAASSIMGSSVFEDAGNEIADIDTRLQALQNFLKMAKGAAA